MNPIRKPLQFKAKNWAPLNVDFFIIKKTQYESDTRWQKIGTKNRKYSNRTTRPSDQNRILASKEGIADINLQ